MAAPSRSAAVSLPAPSTPTLAARIARAHARPRAHVPRAALTTVVAVLATLACDPKGDVVTVHYKQLGACNGFNNGGGVTSAGPNAAYVAFRVSTVDNKDKAPRDFTFEPNRAFVDVTPAAFTNTKLNLAQFNPFYATSRFVAKGTSETINGAVIAVVPTGAADGASEANQTAYTLRYDVPAGGQGVFMAKDNSSQTTFPPHTDCTQIVF